MPIVSKQDANQVLRLAFDDATKRLRTDTTVTASIGTVDVIIDAAGGDNIAISDGVDTMTVNPDGSINTILNHATSSIKIGDGTNLVTTTAVGPKQGLDTNVLNPIKIWDGTDSVNVNPDGSLNVNIVGNTNNSIAYTYVSQFNEINAVPTNTPTIISSYTIPVGKSGYLQRVETSGENIAKYTVYLNGSPIDIGRTYFGNSLNIDFDFTDSNELGINLAAGDLIELEVEHSRSGLPTFDGRIQVILYDPIANVITDNVFYETPVPVASSVLTTIGTYTAMGDRRLQRISCSGDNIAKYIVYVNASPIDVKRTYFGGSLNLDFDYTSNENNGYILNAGDIVEVKVYHTRPNTGYFNSRIQALEV